MIRKIPIVDASDDQIRMFCELQQLDTSNAKTRGDLLAILGPAWEHDHINVPAQEVLEPEAAAVRSQQTMAPVTRTVRMGLPGDTDPRARVKIGYSAGIGGKEPVQVAVNGTMTLVARNVEVDMPYRYYLALVNAVGGEVEQDLNTGDKTFTDVPNYPMTVLHLPSDEEIAEWHARTDHIEIGAVIDAEPARRLIAA